MSRNETWPTVLHQELAHNTCDRWAAASMALWSARVNSRYRLGSRTAATISGFCPSARRWLFISEMRSR